MTDRFVDYAVRFLTTTFTVSAPLELALPEHHAELRPVERAAQENDVITVDIDAKVAPAAKGTGAAGATSEIRSLTMARNGHLEVVKLLLDAGAGVLMFARWDQDANAPTGAWSAHTNHAKARPAASVVVVARTGVVVPMSSRSTVAPTTAAPASLKR